jgi:hypothetical protein
MCAAHLRNVESALPEKAVDVDHERVAARNFTGIDGRFAAQIDLSAEFCRPVGELIFEYWTESFLNPPARRGGPLLQSSPRFLCSPSERALRCRLLAGLVYRLFVYVLFNCAIL